MDSSKQILRCPPSSKKEKKGNIGEFISFAIEMIPLGKKALLFKKDTSIFSLTKKGGTSNKIIPQPPFSNTFIRAFFPSCLNKTLPPEALSTAQFLNRR